MFIEYPAMTIADNREERWRAAFGGWGYTTPMIMVDCGHSITQGAQDYYRTYKAMIDAELPRVSAIEMDAWQRRVGNALRLYVTVRNTSAITLDGVANRFAVWGLAWEEGSTGVTGLYSRAAERATPGAPVPPGGVADVVVDLPIPTGVNWSKLSAVVLAEHRPGGTTGAFDMLQAVRPLVPAFTLSPAELHLGVPHGSGVGEVRFTGPQVLEWSAVSHVPWLAVMPDHGALGTPARVQVQLAPLQPGEQAGSVTFTATSGDGMRFEVELPVTVTLDSALVAQTFAGVASLAGQNQTAWRSSVTAYNPGAEPRPMLLQLAARDTGVTVASRQVELSGGQVWSTADLYAELGAPSGAGTLSVTGDVLAWVRTFNQGEAGTFGQGLAGSGEGAWEAGEVALFPVATAADVRTDFRSNLLLLNLEARALAVTISAGAVTLPVTVPSRTYVQLANVGGELHLPAGIAVVRVAADGRWTGTVSTIDPVTGDPTTVRGQRAP